ncbi:hypothetical protein BGZ80_005043, partial [Entomortierella chlamydospora]
QNDEVVYERQRGDENVNPYNPDLLRFCRSNIDVQLNTSMVWKRASGILQQSRPGSSYFLEKAEEAKADPKEYVTYRRGQSAISPAKVAAEWNKFMKQLKSCDSLEWRNYATDSAVLTKNMVEKWSKEHRDGPPIPGQKASIEDNLTPSMSVEGAKRVLAFPDGNHSSNRSRASLQSGPAAALAGSKPTPEPGSVSSLKSESSLTSESSSTSCPLSQGSVDLMNAEYTLNYNEYQGSSWQLLNGSNVDSVIHRYVLTLSVETLLHSFILDNRDLKEIALCFNTEDKLMFEADIKSHDSKHVSPMLPEDMQMEILKYPLSSNGLRS